MDPAGPEVDGVVAGHLTRVAAAEDEGELARGRTPGGCRIARGAGEAGVQVCEELGQKGLGPLGGGDVAEAQFAAQAILRATGARGLRAILEEVLLNVMYDLPSRTDVERCVIDADVVLEKVNPTLVPRTAAPRVARPRRAAS